MNFKLSPFQKPERARSALSFRPLADALALVRNLTVPPKRTPSPRSEARGEGGGEGLLSKKATCFFKGASSPRLRGRSRFGAAKAPLALALLGCFLTAIPAVRAQDTNPNPRADFSAYKIISDRNIFDPNRRPHYSSGPAPKIVDSFSLVGTMFYGKGHYAIFDGTGSDYRKVLEPGGTIAGYAVTEIGLEWVKLSSGTNQIEIGVGRQLRRNEDGQWSVGDRPESSGSSYASVSNRSRRFSRQSGPSRSRFSPGTDSASPETPAGPPPDTAETPDASAAPEPGPDSTNAPPDLSNADPNDPVARMMQRRTQEMNGNNPNQ